MTLIGLQRFKTMANDGSEAATQELLAIPGLLERVKQNQSLPKTEYTPWRTVRSDVWSSPES